MNIFITGADGFVGGHLIDGLNKEDHKLRCLVHSEKSRDRIKQKGADVVVGDVTIPETLTGILDEIDFVIHLVGIIQETDRAKFEKIHVQGTKNLILESKKFGVKHFFYQSALGSDINSLSGYQRTKAEAEEIVKSSDISYTIFRPSILVGPSDGFTRKLIDIINIFPVTPVPGSGKSKLQPLYINDWVKCALKVVGSKESYCGVFEMGGPEHLTYNEILNKLLNQMNAKRLVLHVPMGLMRFAALFAEKILSIPPVTREQLWLLERDNICPVDSVEKSFGFKPVSYEKSLEKFIIKK